MAAEFVAGLEGVIAGQTKVSTIIEEKARLIYRGYDLHDLTENSSFEEVAYLLIHGELPKKSELDEFEATLKKERDVREEVIETLRKLPKNIHPMDALRTGTSFFSAFDPDVLDDSHEANVRKATRLIAKIPTITSYYWRIREGQDLIKPDVSLSAAANFLYMLSGDKPDEEAKNLMDTSLICYVEHGFNASTFSARVTASTLSDLHSAIVSAIGTLKGPLHGGANEKAMKMLLEIGSPDKAKQWVLDALERKERIMGFGHRVYRHGDSRSDTMKALGKKLAENKGKAEIYEMAQIVEDTVREEKEILPNVDFYSAPAYYVLGIPMELYTPIFVMARVVGWSAHVIEQLDNNRLIRPRSEYIGEKERKYVPVGERG